MTCVLYRGRAHFIAAPVSCRRRWDCWARRDRSLPCTYRPWLLSTTSHALIREGDREAGRHPEAFGSPFRGMRSAG